MTDTSWEWVWHFCGLRLRHAQLHHLSMNVLSAFTTRPLLVALCLFFASLAIGADATKTAVPPTDKKAPASPATVRKSNLQRPIPFRGTIKSIDAASARFTIGERQFKAAPGVKVMRGQKPAKLSEVQQGDWVTGSYKKEANGDLLVSALYIGGKFHKADTNAVATATNKVSTGSARSPQ